MEIRIHLVTESLQGLVSSGLQRFSGVYSVCFLHSERPSISSVSETLLETTVNDNGSAGPNEKRGVRQEEHQLQLHVHTGWRNRRELGSGEWV